VARAMSSERTPFDWVTIAPSRVQIHPTVVPDGAGVLDLPLPASHRAFLGAFGYGLFGGLIHVFPWAPGYGDDLSLRARELRAMFRHTLHLEIAELEPDGSPEALPTLVPFGRSINGHTLCWSPSHAVDGEPEVVVVGSKVLAFHRTGMCFGSFLRALTEPRGARFLMGPSASGLPATFEPCRFFDAWRRAALEVSFADVVARVRARESFGRISGFYVFPEDWKLAPLTTRLYAFDPDGELDDAGDRLRVVTELGLRTLLKVGNLEDVILDRARRAPDSTLQHFVRAVDHYREHDAFER
jgi:hypothetical protein